jgi:hypothetical protein
MTMYKDPDPEWDTKEAYEMFEKAYESAENEYSANFEGERLK